MMSEKVTEAKSKIQDLPERAGELSAEELKGAAGGMMRSPVTGVGRGGMNETTQPTLDGNGDPDTTSSSYDS
jgi:hypothetical protein